MAHYYYRGRPRFWMVQVCKICDKERVEFHSKTQWASHRNLYWKRLDEGTLTPGEET